MLEFHYRNAFYQHGVSTEANDFEGLMTTERAEGWMSRCLSLAAQAQNRASPNPRVGAVLVDSENRLLGEGWHHKPGTPHAEVLAISDARSRHDAEHLRAATLVVNLEPCTHFGQTPPCTNQILDAGIPRVIFGMSDPNPRASGGAEYLQAHGVKVTSGILKTACWRLNEAFAHHVATGRPLVTLKLAQTLDGCIATQLGESRWITGKPARRLVHKWRADSDAILIGSGTAVADDPSLTVRHVDGIQPRRILIDAKGLLPTHLKCFTDSWAAHTTAVVTRNASPAYASKLKCRGGQILEVPTDGAHINLGDLLQRLGSSREDAPIQSLLAEPGPRLATALLRAGLVDRLYLFVAPKLLGGGLQGVGDLGVDRLFEAYTFTSHTWEEVGPDLLFRGYTHAVPK